MSTRRPRHRFTVYRAADGWRWKCHARNGRNVANGSEAYASRRNAERACLTFVASMSHEVAMRTTRQSVIHCY